MPNRVMIGWKCEVAIGSGGANSVLQFGVTQSTEPALEMAPTLGNRTHPCCGATSGAAWTFPTVPATVHTAMASNHAAAPPCLVGLAKRSVRIVEVAVKLADLELNGVGVEVEDSLIHGSLHLGGRVAESHEVNRLCAATHAEA